MAVPKSNQKAVAKYVKENYDDLKIRLPKGERERVKAYAASQGQSVNALIQDLLKREMAGFTMPDADEP
jgi:predicted HicB family RNase H-like nuclease